MRNSLTLFFLTLTLWACDNPNQPNSNQPEYVYVSHGKHASAYHYSKECGSLKNAPDISKVSFKKGKKMGRRPCRICVHDFVISSRKNESKYSEDTIRTNKDANISDSVYVSDTKFYHIFIGCSKLNSKNGFKIISSDDVENRNLELCNKCYRISKELEEDDINIKKILFYLFSFILCFIALLLIVRHFRKGHIGKNSFKPEFNNTKAISLFLQQFAKKDSLKYTTHNWDSSSANGQYQYQNYDDFKEQYCEVLSQSEHEVSSLCPRLWQLINNFMIDDEGGKLWSKYCLKVGYNKYVKQWMDEHPGEQPLNMPLSYFPEEIRPSQIKKRSVNTFRQIVDIFKECIEFRDDNFFYAVSAIFREFNITFDSTNIKCLKGLTFYTNTDLIKDALRLIAGNISQHGDSSNVEVNSFDGKESNRSFIRVEILHIDSFSNRDISDPKITGEHKDGAIASIKDCLRNLCDFAVESTFKKKDKFLPLHINYLVSNASEKGIYSIPKEECQGFKYILTFYTYNQ